MEISANKFNTNHNSFFKIQEQSLLSYWHGQVQHFYIKRGLQAKTYLEEKDYCTCLAFEYVASSLLVLIQILCTWYVWRAYGDWGRGLKDGPRSPLVLPLDPGQFLHMPEFPSHPSDMLALQSIRPRTEQRPANCPDPSRLAVIWHFSLEQQYTLLSERSHCRPT